MTIIKNTFKNYFEAKADLAAARMEKTPTQKLIVSGLVLFSVGVIVIGFLQIKTFLDKPFFSDRLVEDKAKIRGPIEFYNYLLEQNKNQQDLTSLQKRDSDMDGLTDYQEQYIYHTNPYAADTDYDGVKDWEAVMSASGGNNISSDTFNTPSTTTATPTNGSQSSSASQIEELKQLVNQAATLGAGTDNQTDSSLNSQTLTQLTPEQKDEIIQYYKELSTADLRQLLIQQGFPTEQINALSDDDLKKTLDQMLANLQ